MLLPQLDGCRGADGRRSRGRGRHAASGPAGAGRRRRHAMRLLHAGLRDGDVRVPPRRRRRPRIRSSTRRSPAISAAAPAIARSSMPAAGSPPGRPTASPPPASLPPRRVARAAGLHRLSPPRADLSARRGRSTNCSRRASSIPTRCCYAGGTDLGLRVSKDREAFPCVISTARVAELQQIASDAHALTIGGAVTYTQALPHLDRAFPGIRRAGAPHRLAPDPQPRHHRRQSRQRLADRRHAALPDRARRIGDAGVTRRHAHAAGRGVHHRLSQDRAARPAR